MSGRDRDCGEELKIREDNVITSMVIVNSVKTFPFIAALVLMIFFNVSDLGLLVNFLH